MGMHSMALPRIARARIALEIVTPKSLEPPARDALIDELYAVHERIFVGVSREAFAAHVVDPDAVSTRIQIARIDGRAVGYFALHVYERELDGRNHAVVRIESGYLPVMRGRATAVPFLLAELARLCVQYPLRPKHYLGCHVHPSAYVGWSRLVPTWPRPGQPTAPSHERFMTTLARSFGLTPHSESRGIWEVGWITREDPATSTSWAHHSSPAARFYVARNPSFAKGHGLLVHSRITWGALAGGVLANVLRGLASGWGPRARPRSSYRMG